MGTVRNLEPTRQVNRRIRMMHLFAYGIFLILVGFFFNTPEEIARGLWKIMISPSNLLTDYMALANIGATFVNTGLVTIFTVALLQFEKVEITGPVVSAVLTVSGFAFFGKNLFNTVPISLGVYVYGKVCKIDFNNLALSTIFATALGPLVSEIAFGFGLPFYRSIPYAYLAGFIVGFVFSPVANNCLRFHKSYNLYNSGFTAGLLGMFATGILRMFDLKIETVNIISSGNDKPLALVMFTLFILIFLAGYFADGYYPGHYRLLLKHSGLMAGNWIQLYGYGTILMNMSLMGVFCTLYVIFSGGILNGPTIGAILSITGFAAAGVHPKNSFPIFLGVTIASLLNIYDPKSTSAMLAAIFGTALVPIAGEYGFFYGVFAGFSHMAMVMNIGYLHGGTNLYNNGFSAGFIAGTLQPIIASLKSIFSKEEIL